MNDLGEKARENLLNLHDVFLNADLQRDRMDNEPLDERYNEGLEFLIADRFRFERTWLAFLYVLVECWRSEMMIEVRELISDLITDSSIESLILEGKENGSLNAMRDIRHYMFHRDKREYWDLGRTAPLGKLEYFTRLHEEFGRVIYSVM